ncbi:MAG TPA: hypothetical protein P5531_05160 [Bacteroidales bacterium]|nr:hypothetical protein [Bacteroidales bacterium]HSA42607.1 hypothetical protein [Bacteroidales bacterium]
MPVKKKKKTARKLKYRKVSFKLTEKQKKLVDRYCKARKTTPTKMMKAAIRDYLSRYSGTLADEDYISENQLKLFDDDWDNAEEQTPAGQDVAKA